MLEKSRTLENELQELFDIRYAKKRSEKNLNQEAMEAQRDIRVITHMFRDGLPDITIPMGDHEFIMWDSGPKRLIFIYKDASFALEGASRELMVKVRPHLALLVKKAQDFYKN
jgi:hypothetical protein